MCKMLQRAGLSKDESSSLSPFVFFTSVVDVKLKTHAHGKVVANMLTLTGCYLSLLFIYLFC